MSTRYLLAALIAGSFTASCGNQPVPEASAATAPVEHKALHIQANTPDEALAVLKEGNKRYTAGKLEATDYTAQRDATKDDQHPHTMILSCMDSRVPPELIFDQGIGNVFVTRVAGNIEDADILGSMEYAVKLKGTKLIVVMGHSHCGAVKGAIDNAQLGNLTQLVAHIKPAIKGDTTNKEAMVTETVKNNVKLTIAHIQEKSGVISDLVKENKVKIVGAYYDIATGIVEFLQ
jgi:carbonic anhydrase